MPCYVPLRGYFSRTRSPSGKRQVVFKAREGFLDRPVEVPCGQCLGCRLDYARQWAMRCVHEASLHEENSFVTLTYDDKHLPANGSLRKRDHQEFMKRLRYYNGDRNIRFYSCGEYGERTGRPHFHSLLFGLDFDDKRCIGKRRGHRIYRSPTLEKIWTSGISEVGSVSFESAAYVAGYVTKRFRGKTEEETRAYYGGRESPFATMSRRPGLGRGWYEIYKKEIAEWDTVIINAREIKAPRYYENHIETEFPEKYRRHKARRKAAIRWEETSDVRLDKARAVTEARINLFSNRSI